jgi:hypothetical protein
LNENRLTFLSLTASLADRGRYAMLKAVTNRTAVEDDD